MNEIVKQDNRLSKLKVTPPKVVDVPVEEQADENTANILTKKL